MSKCKTRTRQTADTDDADPACGTKRTCTICMTEYPTSEVLSLRRCDHMICRECLTRSFQMATQTESLFPAKCCSMPIRLEDAQRYLSDKVGKQYTAKTAEYTATDRTYCHIPICSTFIPAYSVFDKQAVCPTCIASTCVSCKCEWHEGPCIITEDPQLMQLARLLKLVQCPHCRHLVEKSEGCNHMTCWCGGEFCYVCGVNYPQCECAHRIEAVDEEDDDGRAADVVREIACYDYDNDEDMGYGLFD